MRIPITLKLMFFLYIKCVESIHKMCRIYPRSLYRIETDIFWKTGRRCRRFFSCCRLIRLKQSYPCSQSARKNGHKIAENFSKILLRDSLCSKLIRVRDRTLIQVGSRKVWPTRFMPLVAPVKQHAILDN